MKDKSHLTAITRKAQPVPTRWLLKKGLISLPVLDYGCGKCYKVNPKGWINYDPFWYPIERDFFRGSFRTIICNYVLCTVPAKERMDILRDIQTMLSKSINDATAYITVRNDRPKQGWGKSSRGTYQGRVRKLALPVLYENSQFRIYMLTKKTKLV